MSPYNNLPQTKIKCWIRNTPAPETPSPGGSHSQGGAGGSDGSNGEWKQEQGEGPCEDVGGTGSGLNVSALPMARFVLTPGEVGPRGSIAVPGVVSYGGAGGEIVVNGETRHMDLGLVEAGLRSY